MIQVPHCGSLWLYAPLWQCGALLYGCRCVSRRVHAVPGHPQHLNDIAKRSCKQWNDRAPGAMISAEQHG